MWYLYLYDVFSPEKKRGPLGWLFINGRMVTEYKSYQGNKTPSLSKTMYRTEFSSGEITMEDKS